VLLLKINLAIECKIPPLTFIQRQRHCSTSYIISLERAAPTLLSLDSLLVFIGGTPN